MTHRDSTRCIRRLAIIAGAIAGLSACGPQMVSPTAPADAAADARPLPDASFALPTPAGGPPADAAERATPPACPGTSTTVPRPCATLGVSIDSFYAGKYSCFDLGPVPGVPPQKYGGLTLTIDRCSTTLLIGGDANLATGKLYAVEVTRDPGGHISGFSGTATVHAEAPYNDGGVAIAPNGALLLTRYPNNELQITRPGSTLADKVIDLDLLGVAFASASLNFVPAVVTPGDVLKLVSWSGGQWYTVDLRPDGQGTYDIATATLMSTLPGGPEGFVYVASGSPLFDRHSLLVSEWSANQIATYEVDAQGDPKLETRRLFITGLRGAEGAYRDPTTGDFFFSTWGQAADRTIVVRGFAPISVD